MIHIAICDDEKDFVEHLKGLLLRYSRGRGKKLSDVEFRQLVHILENRNSSKAMSARGRNGNKKTAVAWSYMFPCSSGFVLVVCSWERGLINWKLSPHKFFERNKTKSSLFLHSSYGLSPPSILILIGLCC